MTTPKTNKGNSPLERLRHHVTGAIERGEKTAIVGQPDKGNSPTHIPTSAPWRFIQHGNEYTLWGANKQRVLTIRDGVIPMIPDRQLIEASPELLEACLLARECINHHGIVGDPASFALDAAIAKAKGETL